MSGLGKFIVGGERRYSNEDRQDHDFYVTPKHSVQALIDHEVFKKLLHKIPKNVMWENAVGSGAILDVFENNGFEMVGTDLNDWVDRFETNDFLKNPMWFYRKFGYKPPYIITNPPYKKANEWVLKSLKATGRYLVLFLKLSFLESVSRYNIFKTHPHLKHVLVFSKRQSLKRWSLIEKGEELKSSGTTAYAWFIWDKQYVGLPQIDWIK